MNKAWVKYLTIAFKFFLGCLLGMLALVYYLTHDEYFKQNIEQTLITFFSKSHNLIFEGKIEKIDLLERKIIFQNLSLTSPEDPDWSMHADSMDLKFLFKESWYYKRICYALDYQHMSMHEKFKTSPYKIVNTLQKLFAGTPESIFQLSYVMMHKSRLFFEQELKKQIYVAQYDGTGSAEKGFFKLALYITDGKAVINTQELINNIHASIITQLPASNKIQDTYAKIDAQFQMPALAQEKLMYMNFELFDGTGRCILKSANEGIIIDPVNFECKSDACLFDMHAITSFDNLKEQQLLPEWLQDISGTCKIFMQGDLYDMPASLQGNIALHDILYKENKVFTHADFSIKRLTQDSYESVISVSDQSVIKAAWQYMPEEKWKLAIKNLVTIPLFGSYWQIPEQKLYVQAFIDNQMKAQGNYELALYSPKLEETLQAQGIFQGKDAIQASGNVGAKSYEIKLKLFPHLFLEVLKLQENDQALIDIKQLQKPNIELQGAIDFAFFKFLLPENLQFMFAQEGKVLVQGKQKENQFLTTLSMHDAHIRIPYVYNILEDASCQLRIDLGKRAVYLENVKAKLYEGTIVSKRSTLLFEKNLLPSFIHAPFYVDNVLISWNKGMFGVFSGKVQWDLKDAAHLLRADVVIEKAQLEGNIFSPEFQAQLFGMSDMAGKSTLAYDVSVVTKDMIQIKTSFIDAHAKVQLRAKNKEDQLFVQGSLDLLDGEFKFPYKPLPIVQGKISFIPSKKFDPSLHVLAKGRIKRHDIIMHVSGSATDPHVEFEAIPYLPREQIVSLLLFGSAENSIAIMPDFVHKQLNDIIFGPAVSESKLQRRFHALLEPLKYVRFYPQLDNQQGRGGMRGIIEINATDRLRGKIDSNFFQLEDTKFEVDYDVNDAVTARAVRDGPATYGGEVEMRWKW